MSDARADHLDRRARHLRRLARAIENSPVMHLDALAGDDTWRGPRPQRCVEQLRSHLHQLHAAAEELRWQAYVFARRADAMRAVPGG